MTRRSSETVAANGIEDGYIRLVVTRGCRLAWDSTRTAAATRR